MKRYALIVGIDEYKAEAPLPGYVSPRRLGKARSDAEAVYQLLQAHSDFKVRLLQDSEATGEAIKQALKQLLLDQGAQAEVLFYFAGHGFTAQPSEFERQGYLATYDCQLTGQGKTLTEVKDGLSFAFLNGAIAQAQKAGLAGLAVFLDCCESEYVIEQGLITEQLSKFSGRGCFLSAACRSFESAREGARYGVYTGALFAALTDRAAMGAAGEITVSEAHNRIERELRKSRQEPISFGYGSSMVMVRYREQPDESPVVSEACPYQGLRAFTSETVGVFFGREDEVAALCEKLTRSNFVPVLGPSGSGKSSVVRAGLVTRLEAQGWQVVTMKPDSSPLAILKMEMRAFLSANGVAEGEKRELLRTLETVGLGEMVQQLPGDERVLLLVDQFEEVFTLCDRAEQQRFVGELLAVRAREDARLVVVVTMRSDFVNEWLAVGYPAAVIERDVVWLGPLRGTHLRDAILKPALKRRYAFGEGLLELLLADVAAEDNCLPLLEFALTELWEKRDTQAKKLTAAAYREMGGLKGALNERAETVYNSLREVDKPWAKRVCLRLVRLGKEEKDTRQRQRKDLLLAMGGPEASPNEQQQQTRQMIADVIQALVAGRLLVGDGDYIDLAHEALLDECVRFVAWRQEDRDLRRLVQRMADEYESWQRAKESKERNEDDYLLKGGLLAEVREQREVLSKELKESRPALMQYFADSDRKDAETVAMLQRALADANVLAESLKVRDKLLNNPSKTVGAALSAMALVGTSQQAFQGEVVYPAQDALHRAWFKIRERLKLEGHRDSVSSVAFSPQGDLMVSGSEDNTLRLWDLAGNMVGAPFEGHRSWVRSVAFSPQGDLIVSGSGDHTLRLWDLAGNMVGAPFEGHRSWVNSVAFSPQGDRIVSGSEDKTLRLWDLAGNMVGAPFGGHSRAVNSVAFSPQGDRIVSGSFDNTLRLWDLAGNMVGLPFEGHRSWVNSVAFSPQGDRIASGSNDKTLRLWDLAGNMVGAPFEGHRGWVGSVAFSPQGDRIASGSNDKTLRLWDLAGNMVGAPFEGHRSWVRSVAFSPQGDCIVSGSNDNTLRLWDLVGNMVGTPFEGHCRSVNSVAFSPQGDRIVSGSEDNTLRLWDLAGNMIGVPFEGHSRAVNSVAFSPQGDRIVSGSEDNTLRLWDLVGNMVGTPFEGHGSWVNSVAFSPQGDLIVSGSEDKTLRLWDLAGNAVGLPFEGHSGWVSSVAFSPQGDRIASGSSDKTLRLWDLAGNAVGLPFEGHSDWIRSVAFSPQGDRIVSGSFDHTLRLWDLAGNAVGLPFEGHSSWVKSVAFSLQGGCLISCSDDHTLRLWRVGTWEDELRYCCNTLMHHVALTLPQTEVAANACEVCQQVWTRPQSAAFAVAQGSALARRGEVGKAIAKYNQAKALDPELTLDAVARANELAESYLEFGLI